MPNRDSIGIQTNQVHPSLTKSSSATSSIGNPRTGRVIFSRIGSPSFFKKLLDTCQKTLSTHDPNFGVMYILLLRN